MKINYSEISKTYDNHRSYEELHIQTLVKFADLKDRMKILDVCCGTGNLSAQVMEYIDIESVGIDKSFQMLQKAKEKSLDVMCADVDGGLPFNNRTFDAVIGSYFLHYIKKIESLIADCYRILKEKGPLIFLTSSHGQIEQLHPVLKEIFPSLIERDKERFPDIPELLYFFKTAGFKNIRHRELIISRIPIDLSYLEKVKNRFVSTFYLLSEREFNSGVEKLEAFIIENKETVFREWRGTMICGKK
jgi:ubiquinone/menaquinone biosynthesis C-methylase UbiE